VRTIGVARKRLPRGVQYGDWTVPGVPPPPRQGEGYAYLIQRSKGSAWWGGGIGAGMLRSAYQPAYQRP
jgi:hypothetical protein